MTDQKERLSKSKMKLESADLFIRGFTYLFVSVFALCCLFPFILVVSSSLSSEAAIRLTGFTLWPNDFSTEAYRLLFRNPDQIIGAYIVTILLTVVGTSIGLFIIAMTGYALQRRDFPFRNGISFYIYFTSLFTPGLVPLYMLMTKSYHLQDSYFAILLPLLMSPWLIILMKNFVKAIPHEITESGKIDGAGDFSIFLKLILPSLTPALATIGLFLAIGYWNEWYYSSLFLTSQTEYRPLQFQLYRMINSAAALRNTIAGANIPLPNMPAETLKMATAVIATGPVILIYPFVQKYFVAGLTVGAVKG